MSKHFLGFIQLVTKGIIVENLWFVSNHQFYTQKTQNLENQIFSSLLKLHKVTLYLSHWPIYCAYGLKGANSN
jgi:hypothetical protein